MRRAERVLFQSLQGDAGISVTEMDPVELADIFVLTAFLAGMIHPLQERLWLFSRDSSKSADDYTSFLGAALRRELAPLSSLEPLFANPSRSHLKSLEEKCGNILFLIGAEVGKLTPVSYRRFVGAAMNAMAKLSRFESGLKFDAARSPVEEPFDNSLYRTFDAMDVYLGLDYQRDVGMKIDSAGRERLYEGAGAGVQTSYATLLIALEKINPAFGSRVIDLGSGYGRVGFVIGLLRPDIQFTGYEFVGHRVEVARDSADRAGISEHVHFVAQDLSDQEFVIPEADVYYMYDPFTEETYRRVFQRLKEIARRSAITIVTKGNAGDRFLSSVFNDEEWMSRERYDSGTLSLFRSRPV